jgi:hypothetical protein
MKTRYSKQANSLLGQSSSSEGSSGSATHEIHTCFMGPEVSQDPTTGPYPEPTESNPYPPMLSLVTTARRNLRLRMEETADR